MPSEIGNLQRLDALLLQNNALTGKLPEELWGMESLTKLELEFNSFTGSISAAIGNITGLQTMSLQGNDLTGTVPEEICAKSSLQVASVDCQEVVCRCCAACDNFFSIRKNNEGRSNTTVPGTSAPTLCEKIHTERDCYATSEPLDFRTFNCNPSNLDVIALYHTHDLSLSGITNALISIPNCAEVECNALISEGTLFQENAEADKLALATWPLPVDHYVLVMFRELQPGSVEILAESLPFQVAEQCLDV